MKNDRTRFQILYADKNKKTENFTAAQKKAYQERVKQLRNQRAVFSTWDTRNNGLSSLFRF